jgi:CHAT domain-containing protein
VTPRRARRVGPPARGLLLGALLVAAGGLASGATPAEVARRLAWGERRLRAEDLAAARAIAEEALAQLDESGEPALRIRAELLAGSALAAQGERVGAEQTLARALAGARDLGDAELEARVRLALGWAAWQRADYAAADAAVGAALELATTAGAPRERSEALVLAGSSRVKRGAYAAADRDFERALAACGGVEAGDCAAAAQRALGMSALDRHDYRRAERRLSAAAAGFSRAGDAFMVSRTLAEIGVLHLFEGRPEEGRTWALRALERAVAAGERPAEARARQVLGNAERERGRNAEASAQLTRAAELRRATGNPREQAWALAGAARVLAGSGSPAAARELLAPALAAWRRLEDRRALAWHLLEQARLDLDLHEPEPAERALDEATRIAIAIELPYTSEILRTWSRLERARGEHAAALRRAAEAVAAARRAGNDEMLWRALVSEASAAADSGAQARAVAAIGEALTRIESLRAGALAGDEARIAAVDARRDGFAEAIGVLFDLGRGEEALLVSEQARARALLERRGARPLASLSALAAVARRARSDLLELFVDENRSFAWLVTRRGRIAARPVPAGRARLESLVAAVNGSAGVAPDARRSAGAELARLLLEPFAGALSEDGTPLAVAAQGPLLKLSFAALPAGAGRLLVERGPLFAIPSIAYLAGDRAGSGARGYLLLADPEPPPLPGADRPLPRLPGARRETAAVAALLGARAPLLLTGAEASEERLRALAPGARLIHIAAHGLPDDERPLAGRLALAASHGAGADGASDGLFSAREALELGLGADLVVLSGCGGARGRTSGEGALGFGYALLGAGAHAVLASLWRVPDEVAAFQMEHFYRELAADGGDAAEALRRAQLATRAALAAGRLRDGAGKAFEEEPAIWAPFMLLGRPHTGLGAATDHRAAGGASAAPAG